MNAMFWKNTIWFVLLGMTTILELVLIFRKADDRRRTAAVYLTISGMTFCFEMFVLSYLKAYNYYPKIFPDSSADDNIAGNLFSQFSVSATALLLTVFDLNGVWKLIFIAAYSGIEEGFKALGIYRQHWYRTWMTMVSLLLLFWVAKHTCAAGRTYLKRWLRYLFIFLGLITLHEHLIVWVLRLTGIRLLSEHVLPDKEHSLVVLSAFYMLLLGVFVMFLYFSSIRWGWKLLLLAVLYFGHWLAARYNLILYKESWMWIASSISIWSMYGFTFLLDKLYGSYPEPKP
ncbi:hypothetical protein [Paenibacillus physcomitrellae]|nr:hypothetical protein [Paenibacillus physcomitrellae]